MCQSENDIPVLTKHVEPTTLQNTSITVPEPVFTIQLDMHVPEVRDSPDAEILKNLHGVPNNEDDYPNVQLSVNINSQHLPVLLSEDQNLDTGTAINNEILHSSPEPIYLLPQDNHFQFNHPPDNEDDNDYYQIEMHTTNSQNDDDFTPITNYLRDEIIDSDLQEGWEKIEPDIIPDHCSFTDSEGINMSTNSCEPEDFFNDIFEDRMFTIMAEETNNYACQKIREIMQEHDHFQQTDHHSHRQHARLGTWKDVNSWDMKIFTAHLLVMSSIHKPALHNYWSTKTLSRTPFFGQYISRNKFQDILWNLHVSDTTNNPPPGSPNHDPLAKVRPLLQMCQANFCLCYTLVVTISLDELTMAFKGHVRYDFSISLLFIYKYQSS